MYKNNIFSFLCANNFEIFINVSFLNMNIKEFLV